MGKKKCCSNVAKSLYHNRNKNQHREGNIVDYFPVSAPPAVFWGVPNSPTALIRASISSGFLVICYGNRRWVLNTCCCFGWFVISWYGTLEDLSHADRSGIQMKEKGDKWLNHVLPRHDSGVAQTVWGKWWVWENVHKMSETEICFWTGRLEYPRWEQICHNTLFWHITRMKIFAHAFWLVTKMLIKFN